MSRDHRKSYYHHNMRDRGGFSRNEYHERGRRPFHRKRSRSPPLRSDLDHRRSRSPMKNEKDLLDDNILSEISKLPEPSELWESNQFHENRSYSGPPPPAFSQESASDSRYQQTYHPSYSGIYDDFPPLGSAPQNTGPGDIAGWNQMSLPPPPTSAPFINVEDQMKKEAAIESEMRQQKAALSKQREDYIRKAGILKKELETLKDQRNELRGDVKRSPSPDTKRFLKENTKLQLEIQNKLKTINNVVDMLNGIIGEEAPEILDSDDSERGPKRKSRSPTGKKFNYVYYDPEMHWCRVCDEFPPTAKDYLNHLHSASHHKMAAAHMEAPWHSLPGVNEGFPSYSSAPTKRTPIKGLQFFVPSTAWYCKLCDQFIGDLHCASAHLKSLIHSRNYTNFVEQNPHWETDWMSDRQKAVEKSRGSTGRPYAAHTITFHKDGFHTKHSPPIHTPSAPLTQASSRKKRKERKKNKRKRRSSSSSSSSSNSPAEDKKKKKIKIKSEKKFDTDVKLTEWMSTIQMDRLNDSDRKLLDTLKSRMKNDKQSEERRKDDHQSHSRERERERERERTALDRKKSSVDRNMTGAPSTTESKKKEIKKMPFIGKMPVYKHLGKKVEEQKKEEYEQKKKEEDEASKKRREEMDAEIQKKVAEFKEKIARAQLSADLPPPGIALPQRYPPGGAGMVGGAGLVSGASLVSGPGPVGGAAVAGVGGGASVGPGGLAPEFQEALDIIFPDGRTAPDVFRPMPYPVPMSFGPLGVVPPQMPAPVFGFEVGGAGLYAPRPLYDSRPPKRPKQKHATDDDDQAAQKKQDLDDLALLGIDATDVGANI